MNNIRKRNHSLPPCVRHHNPRKGKIEEKSFHNVPIGFQAALVCFLTTPPQAPLQHVLVIRKTTNPEGDVITEEPASLEGRRMPASEPRVSANLVNEGHGSRLCTAEEGASSQRACQSNPIIPASRAKDLSYGVGTVAEA
jgi:hypothetical protein